jgi:hypothetical protein
MPAALQIPELLLAIFEQMLPEKKRSLVNVCQVNRTWRLSAERLLWRQTSTGALMGLPAARRAYYAAKARRLHLYAGYAKHRLSDLRCRPSDFTSLQTVGISLGNAYNPARDDAEVLAFLRGCPAGAVESLELPFGSMTAASFVTDVFTGLFGLFAGFLPVGASRPADSGRARCLLDYVHANSAGDGDSMLFGNLYRLAAHTQPHYVPALAQLLPATLTELYIRVKESSDSFSFSARPAQRARLLQHIADAAAVRTPRLRDLSMVFDGAFTLANADLDALRLLPQLETVCVGLRCICCDFIFNVAAPRFCSAALERLLRGLPCLTDLTLAIRAPCLEAEAALPLIGRAAPQLERLTLWGEHAVLELGAGVPADDAEMSDRPDGPVFPNLEVFNVNGIGLVEPDEVDLAEAAVELVLGPDTVAAAPTDEPQLLDAKEEAEYVSKKRPSLTSLISSQPRRPLFTFFPSNHICLRNCSFRMFLLHRRIGHDNEPRPWLGLFILLPDPVSLGAFGHLCPHRYDC